MFRTFEYLIKSGRASAQQLANLLDSGEQCFYVDHFGREKPAKNADAKQYLKKVCHSLRTISYQDHNYPDVEGILELSGCYGWQEDNLPEFSNYDSSTNNESSTQDIPCNEPGGQNSIWVIAGALIHYAKGDDFSAEKFLDTPSNAANTLASKLKGEPYNLTITTETIVKQIKNSVSKYSDSEIKRR